MSTLGVDRLGFAADQVVQEFGYDADVVDEFRFAIEDLCGGDLEDEDYTGTTDAVILWWRAGDGDLSEVLMDLGTMVEDGGFVVLLVPKQGAAGAVEASEVDEAASTAGLHASESAPVGDNWRATRLVAPRSRSRR